MAAKKSTKKTQSKEYDIKNQIEMLFFKPRLAGKFLKPSFLSEFKQSGIEGDAAAEFEKMVRAGDIYETGETGDIKIYKRKVEVR